MLGASIFGRSCKYAQIFGDLNFGRGAWWQGWVRYPAASSLAVLPAYPACSCQAALQVKARKGPSRCRASVDVHRSFRSDRSPSGDLAWRSLVSAPLAASRWALADRQIAYRPNNSGLGAVEYSGATGTRNPRGAARQTASWYRSRCAGSLPA